jgi:hypothetical protein
MGNVTVCDGVGWDGWHMGLGWRASRYCEDMLQLWHRYSIQIGCGYGDICVLTEMALKYVFAATPGVVRKVARVSTKSHRAMI